jgi:hypothetical protein
MVVVVACAAAAPVPPPPLQPASRDRAFKIGPLKLPATPTGWAHSGARHLMIDECRARRPARTPCRCNSSAGANAGGTPRRVGSAVAPPPRRPKSCLARRTIRGGANLGEPGRDQIRLSLSLFWLPTPRFCLRCVRVGLAASSGRRVVGARRLARAASAACVVAVGALIDARSRCIQTDRPMQWARKGPELVLAPAAAQSSYEPARGPRREAAVA